MGRTDCSVSEKDVGYQNEAEQYAMNKALATLFENCFIW